VSNANRIAVERVNILPVAAKGRQRTVQAVHKAGASTVDCGQQTVAAIRTKKVDGAVMQPSRLLIHVIEGGNSTDGSREAVSKAAILLADDPHGRGHQVFDMPEREAER